LCGNQDFFPRPPRPGVNNEIANGPSLIINDEIFDMANIAVQSLDVVTAYRVRAAQMGILSPVSSKPAREGRFKTGHSEARDSYHFCFFSQGIFAAS
jgi:hypothetical protein